MRARAQNDDGHHQGAHRDPSCCGDHHHNDHHPAPSMIADGLADDRRHA
jgi:hypothetical protein